MMAYVAIKTTRPIKYSALKYFSPARIRILKAVRVVFFILGATLIFLGSIAQETKNQGISPPVLSSICFGTLVIVIWASIYMFGTVTITNSKITTQNFWRRSMDLSNVSRLDIVRTHLFGQAVLLPTIFGKDGKAMPLLPIGWRFTASPFSPAWTTDQQTELVHSIRDELNIDGKDA